MLSEIFHVVALDQYAEKISSPNTDFASDPGHSAKNAGSRLQLNMHVPYVCGFAWSDVTWRMIVWCMQNVLRQQQFHVAPAM